MNSGIKMDDDKVILRPGDLLIAEPFDFGGGSCRFLCVDGDKIMIAVMMRRRAVTYEHTSEICTNRTAYVRACLRRIGETNMVHRGFCHHDWTSNDSLNGALRDAMGENTWRLVDGLWVEEKE